MEVEGKKEREGKEEEGEGKEVEETERKSGKAAGMNRRGHQLLQRQFSAQNTEG